GRLLGDGRAVHAALGVPVEAAWREGRAGRDVAVATREAVHELVRRVRVRVRDAGALLELHQRDRGAVVVVAPQRLVRQAGEGLVDPLQVAGLDEHLLERVNDVGGQVGRPRVSLGDAGGVGGRDTGSVTGPVTGRGSGCGAARRRGRRDGRTEGQQPFAIAPADVLELDET